MMWFEVPDGYENTPFNTVDGPGNYTCTTCGAIVPNHARVLYRHMEWHNNLHSDLEYVQNKVSAIEHWLGIQYADFEPFREATSTPRGEDL